MRAPLFALAALVTLGFSCGRPPCDSRSCPTGCCTASGECQAATTPLACGVSGAQCLACRAGQSCMGGLCVGGSNTGGSGGSGGSTGTGGTGGGSNSNAPSCSVAADCPYWYCDCLTGPPVNSRHCTNNRCESGAQACPSACAAFSTCWVGTSSGGYVGGSNAGPSTCGGSGGGTGGSSGGTCPVSDLGRGCQSSSDCQSNLCYGVSPSYICTRACSAANDCPRGWECIASTAGNKICMEGPHPAGTVTSTSTVCTGASITDVGQTCNSSCQGGFCSSNLCSRRCVSSSDCPPSWTCNTTGSSFNYCAP